MRPATLLLALGLTTSLLSSDAHAGELREPLLAALSGIEDVPTADDLRSLGDGVEAELLELAQDDSLSRTKRARAVHALGWFPSDISQTFLVSTLAGDDSLTARKAAYALANGWGDGAIPLLGTALASDDVQLRVATARALGNVSTESARSALSARLAVETNATVQATIRTSLGQ